MNATKVDSEVGKKTKSRNAVKTDATVSEGNRGSSLTWQKAFNDIGSSADSRIGSGSAGGSGTIGKGAKQSPELTRRMSRTEAVRQDAIKLKSVTLDRMGKMFKQRPQTPIKDKSSIATDAAGGIGKSVDDYEIESSGKEKTNSLGRMLKLEDKTGSPKKLFTRPRGRSLSSIIRRQLQRENALGSTPGMISRMLNQFRGRPTSGNSTTEPNIKTAGKMSSLPPKVPLASRTGSNLSTSSPSPSSLTEASLLS